MFAMKYDIFFSICQTEVDGYLPNERTMWENFFDQVRCADTLGFGTAWLAETHLSCQVQKENPGAVIPHFKGEIGLNTDILQLAHLIFQQTKNLNVGSAIRNILCNGGPVAHAEAVKTFLSLHALRPNEKRVLELGFAAGRFPFSYHAYGIKARDPVDEAAWEVVKNKVFQEATLIMLRLLRGDHFASKDIGPLYLRREDFRDQATWDKVYKLAKEDSRRWDGGKIGQAEQILHLPFFVFDKVGVIPFEAPLELLRLTIGSHDPTTQRMANEILPTGVFNLSITPAEVIEETHCRMRKEFHSDGGAWTRAHMPRTALIFVDATEGLSPQQQSARAREQSRKAWQSYWVAMEKTLDPKKVESAVENSIAGNPEEVAQAIVKKYHPEDRLMLWFDFNNHDNEQIKKSMRVFMEKIKPRVEELLR
jgi:alkanesulfonate monooxygenase SsuD/methylene tetrahydromethanopterin reductase-like flavin-dependent oxidoreductase (luciferase family)